MYPFSLLNICYGYTCPEMRTAGALINGLKCQLGLLQFLLASLHSWPKMPISLPQVKQSKSNFLFFQTKSSSGTFPSAASIFFSFIIVMPLCRQYHRILGIESTLKVHTLFFYALARLLPTQPRQNILEKIFLKNHNLPTVHGISGCLLLLT